jgi:hypothetical protein
LQCHGHNCWLNSGSITPPALNEGQGPVPLLMVGDPAAYFGP